MYIILHYTDYGSPESSNKNNPAEHAELMLAVFQHMQSKYGFVPDAIEVIDEPNNAGWSGSQIGAAIVAVGNRLKANGFNPEFLGPSSSSISEAISAFDALIQVPGVQSFFKKLVYHRYGEGSIAAAAARGIQYDIRTAMLGCGGCSYEVLHDDIKNGRNSAWQQGVLTGNSNGGNMYIFIEKTEPQNLIAYMSTLAKHSRQYIKFIKRGAQRIKATSTSGTFEPLAFINPGGKYTVVVKAAGGGSFSVQNLPAGTYGIKYTTPSEYDIDLPDVIIAAGQNVDTSIPHDGVLTVYQKTTTGNPPAVPTNPIVK